MRATSALLLCTSLLACRREEAPADVEHPQSLRTSKYVVDYPANWELGTGMTDSDPASGFRITSPGGCYVQVTIHNEPIDLKQKLHELTLRRATFMGESRLEKITFWGRYSGKGLSNRGEMGKDSGVQGWHDIFGYTDPRGGFLVTEECTEASAKMVKPGFSLIERSFVYRP
jgi:hypothetical protein